MKVNYQLLLNDTLERIGGAETPPSLLLHCCCAPCSSYVLEYLNRFFAITAYYDNPNISPVEEYHRRSAELTRLAGAMPFTNPVQVLVADYEPACFDKAIEGVEHIPEGGERCRRCYTLRLKRSAEAAKAGGFDYFTTTLSISPMKNAQWLNEIGGDMAAAYGIPYLYSDFKKRGGYKRSTELSAVYGLYRQDYCGCAYSRQERDERIQKRAEKEGLAM